MTPLLFVGAAAAGGVGAALRYLLDLAVQRLTGSRFPWGILVVNLTGAFALGVLSGGLVDASGIWVLGTGLLGGYTTFGSVAVTTVLLAGEGRTRGAVGYATATFVGSVVLAAGGVALGTMIA